MNLTLVAGGALVLLLAWQTVRLADEQAERAGERAHYAEQLRQAAQANERRSERVRELEGDVATARQENEDAQLARLDLARRDRAAADAAAGQLAGAVRLWRNYADAVAAKCGAASAGATAERGGQAGAGAGDLLADVLRRIDEAAGAIGSYADEGRARHERCVADYAAVERASAALRQAEPAR